MSIYAFTGKPRHGKTYLMAKTTAKLLKKGERVFSNIFLNLGEGALKNFKPPILHQGIWYGDGTIVGDLMSEEDRKNEEKQLFYWRNIHDWNHMEKGNIMVDEGQRYFNSRQWEQLSEDTQIKLQQHGKEDLNVWVTVQHHSRIDIVLRQLIEKYTIVKTIWGNPNNLRPFLGLKIISAVTVDEEDLDDYDRIKKMPDLADRMVLEVSKRLVLFRKKFAVIYDTKQQIGKSESMPLVHKSRICKVCGKEKISHF